uniref:Uncharacterized protein n=1 Tax=Chromera velia CCMP2878 TaxID=1169474 RepID=A0A0G4F9S6_9ALVE|eukprot:Cvel_15916.t1-p1 / transcript=Cvel_15916.t1 / gene=Cvel_15916 / organism=Chromera_velia_CCMP2878 / gene_product=hypothetical protein / transcript_product=hypothetical protein / location=Cvel_scaffold1203:30143-31765(-) / protein_length=541 / sequence_SO=supercontig / SO=protein_coding / is_pseudo=false
MPGKATSGKRKGESKPVTLYPLSLLSVTEGPAAQNGHRFASYTNACQTLGRKALDASLNLGKPIEFQNRLWLAKKEDDCTNGSAASSSSSQEIPIWRKAHNEGAEKLEEHEGAEKLEELANAMAELRLQQLREEHARRELQHLANQCYMLNIANAVPEGFSSEQARAGTDAVRLEAGPNQADVKKSLQQLLSDMCEGHRRGFEENSELAPPPKFEVVSVKVATPESELRVEYSGKRRSFLMRNAPTGNVDVLDSVNTSGDLSLDSLRPLFGKYNPSPEKWGERWELSGALGALGVLSTGAQAVPFHGADEDTSVWLRRRGLDPRYAGGRGFSTRFGRGCYFSDLFSKAHLYTGPGAHILLERVPGRVKDLMHVTVFVVLLGNVHAEKGQTAEGEMRRRGLAPEGFDSVWGVPKALGGTVNKSEFVVYERKQAIPLFTVEYRHLYECECARCGPLPKGAVDDGSDVHGEEEGEQGVDGEDDVEEEDEKEDDRMGDEGGDDADDGGERAEKKARNHDDSRRDGDDARAGAAAASAASWFPSWF